MWDSLWTWVTPGMEALLRLAPALTLLLAVLGLVGALATFRQKSRVDRAADWWNRVEAALAQAASSDMAVAAWSRSMLDYLCEPKFRILQPGTWRRRWRITSRDRIIIADLLTAIVERGHLPLATSGPITQIAIPGLPLQVGPYGGWQAGEEIEERELLAAGGPAEPVGSKPAQAENVVGQQPVVDRRQKMPDLGDWLTSGGMDEDEGPPPAPTAKLTEDELLDDAGQPAPEHPVPAPADALPPPVQAPFVAAPAPPTPVGSVARAQAELVLRLNAEAGRRSPQLIADLAGAPENGNGRPPG